MIPVYAALADYAGNKDGLCWPRMSTLADTLNLSTRTVQRHVAALVAAGLVELVERRRSARGRFSSYVYRLVLVAGFSRSATTGHGRRSVKPAPNRDEHKQRNNAPQSPPIRGEEGARRRRSGYAWLFDGPGEGEGTG